MQVRASECMHVRSLRKERPEEWRPGDFGIELQRIDLAVLGVPVALGTWVVLALYRHINSTQLSVFKLIHVFDMVEPLIWPSLR